MKHIASFRPRFFEVLRGYSRQTFSADLMAGLVVGIVALPLAIAFGIASGVSPEKGIITAVVAGFVVSLLGGSRVQIGGPTGAFIVIVYGVVQQYGETGLLVATFMAGVLLVLMGLFRLGTVIKFIPYPIVVGFTAGIALTIFTTQIPDLLGLDFGGEAVRRVLLAGGDAPAALVRRSFLFTEVREFLRPPKHATLGAHGQTKRRQRVE